MLREPGRTGGRELLKPVSAVLVCDARFTNMVAGVDANSVARMMSITDMHALVATLELDQEVPADIHEQFDKARHAFIYSWFAYDLASLAEQQGYQTLELALREKLPEAERKKATEKRWGLQKLLKHAVAHRWLVRSDFEAPPRYAGEPNICFLDEIAICRNELAHGSRHLFPHGTLIMLQLCADVLNRLFKKGNKA